MTLQVVSQNLVQNLNAKFKVIFNKISRFLIFFIDSTNDKIFAESTSYFKRRKSRKGK